ncbi:MAG: hypothetical protein ACLTTE_02835 [Clostridia bacterium]|jgi:hypothetical protein
MAYNKKQININKAVNVIIFCKNGFGNIVFTYYVDCGKINVVSYA